jgi:hypothetical protein
MAEDVSNTSAVCRFMCVKENQCAATNPEASIADSDAMVCRGCQVEACVECLNHGEDVCHTCAPKYKLMDDGQCESEGYGLWIAGLTLTALFCSFLTVYCCQLCTRPNINNDGVKRGIRDRWRSRNKPPADEDGAASPRRLSAGTEALMPGTDPRGKVWPITTNLCRTSVAGPGIVLYFNFQCLLIVWAMLVLLGWATTASAINWDLFTLGIRDTDTPRSVCQNVRWGHNTQEKYMFIKVIFMGGVYVVTFLMVIIHATLQYRRYQDVDDSTTMKDFCAYLTRLPKFHGSELAEERIKQVVEAATGEKVIGVSICWDYAKDEEKITKSIEYEMNKGEEEAHGAITHGTAPAGENEEDAELSGTKKWFRKVDNLVISLIWGWEQDHDPDVDEEALIKGIKSYDKAFVVFNEESARDAAVNSVKRMPSGLQFEGTFAKLTKQDHEPESVQWTNFGYSWTSFYLRLFIGLFVVFIGLIVWAVVVYVPYAYYFTSYPYAQGDEPGVGVQIAFTLMITLGNEILYILVGMVCDWIGFRYTDGINCAYLLIYTTSCFLALVLDLVVSVFMVYTQLEKSEAFNSNGQRIIDLSDWKSVIESYPMQKAMGWEMFLFAFPASMLAPFVVEPFLFIHLPYWVGWALVRSRTDLGAGMNEKCLGFTQDIEPNARYADLIVNVLYVIMILFFPSGYIMILFTCLLGSHIFIYALDHWQTLRATRSNYFSSQAMDVSASAFMSVPLGLLLCIIIFKFHCLPSVLPLDTNVLAAYCVMAFIAHVTIHVLIVLKLVPKLGKRGHIRSSLCYPEAAKKAACNWFTANPMHCLRSQYMYKHSPPCQFFVEGKENLIKANPDIGLYYQDVDDDWMPPNESTYEEVVVTNAKHVDGDKKGGQETWSDQDDNDLAPIVDTVPSGDAAAAAGDVRIDDGDVAP